MIIMLRGFVKILTSVSITMEGVARLHTVMMIDDDDYDDHDHDNCDDDADADDRCVSTGQAPSSASVVLATVPLVASTR